VTGSPDFLLPTEGESLQTNESTMETEKQKTIDRTIIERYTDQPARIPAEVRAAVESAWGGRPVQLYALIDLDGGMQLTERWLALGEESVAIAIESGMGWDVSTFPRSRVEVLREAPGLSGSTLTFLGAPGDPALAMIRYTHRQRRAIENIRFVLQQDLEGRSVPVRWPMQTASTPW
jgi:ATP-binding cassette, subfamily B, bacterial